MESDCLAFFQKIADWMQGDSSCDGVLLTSRLRLARNIADREFPLYAGQEKNKELAALLFASIKDLRCMQGGFVHYLKDLGDIERGLLVERHLMSPDFASKVEGRALGVDRSQSLSILINEEDHLRLQAFGKGCCLEPLYESLRKIDEEIGVKHPYAFDARWGYLTACPTNLGTGLRASSMLHLPGLVISNTMRQSITALGKIGLVVRGFFGEGSESLGDIFQVSNQSTLGESEETIIQRLNRVTEDLREQELFARQRLWKKNSRLLVNHISRAHGKLSSAFFITTKEALVALSFVRLGVYYELYAPEVLGLCNHWTVCSEPAHLQYAAKETLDSEQRDAYRSDYLRKVFCSLPAPSLAYKE